MIIWHDVIAIEKIEQGQLLTVERHNAKWVAYPAKLTGERTSCDAEAVLSAEVGAEVELNPVNWIIKDALRTWDWEKNPEFIYA